ncbi:unnamed protein product [Tuber melanosporum]|uniref:(Perigord truffle) hypothetical protein n=1 Tax=Tuber melanosporum (strain Mel28) TaxID=656061 RepID=D5GBP2_TUBMM|nr:uncharacterized protein GSTUM_00005502001 [Tuber melanosporum]CAZ81892.1 unnamed protein product [Tuber melanosporum]
MIPHPKNIWKGLYCATTNKITNYSSSTRYSLFTISRQLDFFFYGTKPLKLFGPTEQVLPMAPRKRSSRSRRKREQKARDL